jgi:hypothetical protein
MLYSAVFASRWSGSNAQTNWEGDQLELRPGHPVS